MQAFSLRVKRRCTTQLAKTRMSTNTTERRNPNRRTTGVENTTSTSPRLKANGHAHANSTRPAKPPYRFDGDLPAALEPLRARKQWLTWDYVWNADKNKWDKPPCSAHTGRHASINKPANLGTFAEAAATAAKRGMAGVGFLLQPDDGMTGFDVDHCVGDAGTFSETAAEVIGYGETYFEFSPSGEGIRGFVLGKVEKSLKDDASGVEVYPSGRYLTVTGCQIEGTPSEIRPAPNTLAKFTAIVEAARGPKRVKPNGNAQASSDFWSNVNAAALANLDSWVPDLHPTARKQATGAWRITSKDLGRNLEEDLAYHPGGIRDHGEERGLSPIDAVQRYGSASDATAAAMWLCHRLGVEPTGLGWQGRANEANEQPQSCTGAENDAGDPVLAKMNADYAVVKVGGKTRVVSMEDNLTYPGCKVPVYSTVADFCAFHMNPKKVVVGDDDKARRVGLGRWWINHEERRQYDGIVYAPGADAKATRGKLNLWSGFGCAPRKGDFDPYLAHLRDNVCSKVEEHSEYLLNWMAYAVQHPGRQGEVAVVMRGKEGVGKGVLAKEFGRLFGSHYRHISQAGHLTGHFNAHLQQCSVLFADEAFFAGDRSHEFDPQGAHHGRDADHRAQRRRPVPCPQLPPSDHVVQQRMGDPGRC